MKKLFLTLFVLTLTAGGLWFFCWPVTATVDMSALEQRLAQQWPAQQKSWQLVQLSWQSPTLSITPDNRLAIALAGEVKFPLVNALPGSVLLHGDVSYRRQDKSFYLERLSLQSINFANVPAGQTDMFKDMVNKNVATQLASFKVYQLQDADLPQRVAKATLRDIALKNGQLKLNFCNPYAPDFLSSSCNALKDATPAEELSTRSQTAPAPPLQ